MIPVLPPCSCPAPLPSNIFFPLAPYLKQGQRRPGSQTSRNLMNQMPRHGPGSCRDEPASLPSRLATAEYREVEILPKALNIDKPKLLEPNYLLCHRGGNL